MKRNARNGNFHGKRMFTTPVNCDFLFIKILITLKAYIFFQDLLLHISSRYER